MGSKMTPLGHLGVKKRKRSSSLTPVKCGHRGVHRDIRGKQSRLCIYVCPSNPLK